MERRAFLTGLLGVAGAAALAGVAQAAPIARPLELLDEMAEPTTGARAPDGTPVQQAQVSVQIGTPPRRRYRHRRRRTVCRTEWWRGRPVRRCRSVWY